MMVTVMRRVYPRVCGGTCSYTYGASNARGLSPRVRGNRHYIRQANFGARSIPACAGEPYRGSHYIRQAKVYPRVCGGTVVTGVALGVFGGLSPRVRGNPPTGNNGSSKWRSIPACAGEPMTVAVSGCIIAVYPRVCGGTRRWRWSARCISGLSPRVRGNPAVGEGRRRRAGSIPACAGEPRISEPPRQIRQVYPRVCGGTTARVRKAASMAGLSPRVRGNLRRPAPPDDNARVYPRVCGGTTVVAVVIWVLRGLSPRVRGNP